jgi:hypothetical protein
MLLESQYRVYLKGIKWTRNEEAISVRLFHLPYHNDFARELWEVCTEVGRIPFLSAADPL